jgi:hypothetical protein
MRQPTFFAQACPRLDHHEYCSGRGSSRRNTSTQPRSSITPESHARSSGRKPEFFWFERQFFRSISLWAMFQSPQTTTSRPLRASASMRGRKRSRKLNFAARRSSELEPEGRYSDTTLRFPKSA